jgi:hypothetical protein
MAFSSFSGKHKRTRRGMNGMGTDTQNQKRKLLPILVATNPATRANNKMNVKRDIIKINSTPSVLV